MCLIKLPWRASTCRGDSFTFFMLFYVSRCLLWNSRVQGVVNLANPLIRDFPGRYGPTLSATLFLISYFNQRARTLRFCKPYLRNFRSEPGMPWLRIGCLEVGRTVSTSVHLALHSPHGASVSFSDAATTFVEMFHLHRAWASTVLSCKANKMKFMEARP